MTRYYLTSAVLAIVFFNTISVRAQEGFVLVTDAMLQNPDPGEWLTWRRTPNGWG